MLRHVLTSFVLLAVAALFSAGAALAKTPAPDEAQRIYQAYGDAIYQVQDIDTASGKKSSIGSGFQFTEDGLIATNYHVVATALRHPEGNRLEYLHDKGEKGALKILAADVVHDLAILKMDRPGENFIRLGSSRLPKGARLFSLGNPHDIGFTIIEGTYNGLSSESFSDRIHFSGALNPGMSGGPALSHDGAVVGINVSTAGNQISFLVPVEPLRDLAAAARAGKGDFAAHAAAGVEKQLLEAQKRNVDALLSKKWESVPFGPLMVPGRIDDALKCWGVPMHEEKDPYRFNRSICATQDRLYLDDGFETGSYSYRYDYITAREKMDPLRFYNFYEQQYSTPSDDSQGREEDFTNYECTTRFVRVAERKWKASFCARQYRDYPQVFDMEFIMAMVDAGREGMIASLNVEGVSHKNALDLAKRFMTEIRVPPPRKTKEGRKP